jgi:hypothetical protein
MRAASKAVIVGSVVLGVPAGAVAGVWVLLPHFVPPSGAVPGLRIDGTELSPGQDVFAHAAERARQIENRTVRIRLAGTDQVVVRSLGQLGVRVEASEIARRASAVGRQGALATRLVELRRARRGEIDVPLSIRVDAEQLAAVLGPLKEETDRAPIPARLKLQTRTVVPPGATSIWTPWPRFAG